MVTRRNRISLTTNCSSNIDVAGEEPIDSAAMSGDAGRFQAYLETTGQAWLLVEQADDQQARVRFSGPFEGRDVVWDCRFSTLSAVNARRNFIEIGPPQTHGIPLQVGLSLASIDTRAIQKMIIMIRNYKNLRTGYHAYGEPVA